MTEIFDKALKITSNKNGQFVTLPNGDKLWGVYKVTVVFEPNKIPMATIEIHAKCDEDGVLAQIEKINVKKTTTIEGVKPKSKIELFFDLFK